jgi:hypothetical protein
MIAPSSLTFHKWNPNSGVLGPFADIIPVAIQFKMLAEFFSRNVQELTKG